MVVVASPGTQSFANNVTSCSAKYYLQSIKLRFREYSIANTKKIAEQKVTSRYSTPDEYLYRWYQ